MSLSNQNIESSVAPSRELDASVVTPLIAFGCALGVFLIVVLIILLDSTCRKRIRKQKSKSKNQLNVPQTNDDFANWKDIEVGTPNQPQLALHDSMFSEDEFEEPHPADHFAEDGNKTPPGTTDLRPLSDMLVSRLEEFKSEDDVPVCESPLDYGYEGEDNSSIVEPKGFMSQ